MNSSPSSFLLACVVIGAAAASFGVAGCSSKNDDTPSEEGDPNVGPQRLSETGLYSDFASRTVAPNVLRFAPSHPLWADGSEKTRFLLLPPNKKIDTRDMDRWVFPVGTKVWKEFRIGNRLVETRLLWKRRSEPAGTDSWWKAAYIWDANGSDATATIEGVKDVLGTTHDVPSQEDCTACHLYVSDTVIGFSALELSTPEQPAPDAGLLLALGSQGLFTDPPPVNFAVPGSGLARDALGYLHGNCGFCHNERMTQLIGRTIRLRLSTRETTIEQTGPYTTTMFGTKMKHIINGSEEAIVPADPDKSQVYLRITDLNPYLRMPPKATEVVDPRGSTLIRDWILSLSPR